jgi:hypothetical protein
MAFISAAKLLSVRFENYLTGVFHPIPAERVIAGIIQSIYGWFFTWLRNALICGLLQYLAHASESTMLKILAIAAYVTLVAYCVFSINMWVLTPFHFVKHKRLGLLLDGVVTLALLSLTVYAIFGGIWFAINEIEKGHTAVHSNALRNPADLSPSC